MVKPLKLMSKITQNACTVEQLYNFVSDFTNFSALVPPDFKDKASFTRDTITIDVMNQKITLHLVEKQENDFIKLSSVGNQEATIWVQLKLVAPYDTRIRVTLHAEMPLAVRVMIKGKMQTFVDGVADALAQIPAYAMPN